MATEPLNNAGVRFPPPFVYLLGLLAALLINRRLPLWLVSPEPRSLFWLGVFLLLAGLGVAVSGILTFRRHQTSVIPFHPARTIVTSGPYRITRNPMYLGLAGSYIGCSFVLDTWWSFILLPAVVLIIDRAVIRREERYLSSAFGAEYETYRARVRRWL